MLRSLMMAAVVALLVPSFAAAQNFYAAHAATKGSTACGVTPPG